jgi:predicted AAA+ superfamily ATPase
LARRRCSNTSAQIQRSFVTLDDPLVLNLAKTDPALFLQRFPPPVLIDEVQYAATELFPYVKMAVDRDFEPGMFWLTGSQQFHLMQGISESLAGRVAVLHLFGLSRRELLGQGASVQPFLPAAAPVERSHGGRQPITLPALYRLIWRGTLPAIATNDAIDRDLFYSSYTQTYLQRDVRDLARVGDEMAFLRFLRATAARTGQILNLADLARDADVTPNTAKHWLSILQTAGMVYLLAPYHANISKRLVKTPETLLPGDRSCGLPDRLEQPGDAGGGRHVRCAVGNLGRGGTAQGLLAQRAPT